jgi:2,5-diamino-6-(ribosylamino)-4(3H)-pyrimidinone 5'-phosphate reductase
MRRRKEDPPNPGGYGLLREAESELPYVVVHVAVSVDGAIDGFEPNVGRYYELASRWEEDVTLAGADTILAQEPALAEAPGPGPAADGPLLAVVDARCRVSAWSALRECGHWSDVVALRGHASDPSLDPHVRELATGGERVDLEAALSELRASAGAELVRVDSGGSLNGALLASGLIDELSLLVHPCLAGEDGTRRWHGDGPAPPARKLAPLGVEQLEGGLTWLRYRVGGHPA